ncbi:outer membrane beta-barrel protein [Hoylesella shahii]|uniref:outer membrane beta-barrel protein n=1 Tax=Hoylesella shahii TaxID=228603 RepID=UPI00248DA687|nr:outer membrane beta-barrel protein [Hoylesella shahii]
MKRILFILLTCIMCAPLFAQKGQAELAVYGGKLSFTKIDNPYFGSFDSGFGFGFQAKYFLTNRMYWAADLYGGTDDGTTYYEETAIGRTILSAYRQDYSISTGIGFNFVSLKHFNSYIQGLVGIGTVDGYTSNYISETVGFKRDALKRTSYLVTAGAGLDFAISKHWKIGGAYTFRYLGSVDGSHAIVAKISYVIH